MFDSLIREIVQMQAKRHVNVPPDLLQLLSFTKKSEAEKYCRTFVLKQSALVSLILNAPALGYRHARQHREFQPVHLHPTDADLQSLRDSVHPGAPSPAKTLRKLTQMFDERKQVHAHAFMNDVKWHMFYFTGKDTDEDTNHWEHGAHVHFVNHLWPNVDIEAVWKSFESRDNLHPGVHIRWMSTSTELENAGSPEKL